MKDKSMLSESGEIKAALVSLIREIVRDETKACLRTYKAILVEPPFVDENGKSVCTVRMIGDQTELNLPYSSEIADATKNSFVWIATFYGSFRNAIVWKKI